MKTNPQVPDCFYRTSIKALVLDDHKRFLLTKDEKSGKWDLPGGGLDWGEDPHACIAREIQEEMGIPTTWIADHSSYFLVSTSDAVKEGWSIWITNIVYATKLAHLNFTPSNECVDMGFFSSGQAKDQALYSNVLKFIEVYNPANH